MAKAKILQDTFEQLAELGTSTAKKTVKSVAQTVNPLTALETSHAHNEQEKKLEEMKKDKNHTELDLQKLQNKYDKSDEQKTAELRNRLFQMVKQGEQQVLEEKKRGAQEELQQEEYAKQQKQRQIEEKQQQETASTPQGKIRKNILGGKKPKTGGMEQHAEYKPSSSKN